MLSREAWDGEKLFHSFRPVGNLRRTLVGMHGKGLQLRGQGFSGLWCSLVSCRIHRVLHRNYARFWSGQRVHPDVVTFNTAISACAKSGSWVKSVELFCDLDSDHELRIAQTCFFSALLCSAFQRGSNVSSRPAFWAASGGWPYYVQFSFLAIFNLDYNIMYLYININIIIYIIVYMITLSRTSPKGRVA